ncbi:hypothetical protein L1987_73599 [Smallanthus sonchifolius]|uniref:Uncharacterized protein n=1 Tax=Smallanthus sonchifolius TaxID=185202 RepID=A0ACB9A153_9ASTR|nr:hypothetical protein L1987_73599 [Smallanthus sonchifolius]
MTFDLKSQKPNVADCVLEFPREERKMSDVAEDVKILTAVFDKIPGEKCPKCDSTNTKFCWFHNYNLSQPVHFCNTCTKYWTRSVSKKNNRSSSSSSSSSNSVSKTLPSVVVPSASTTVPYLIPRIHDDHHWKDRVFGSNVSEFPQEPNSYADLNTNSSVTATDSFMPIPAPDPDLQETSNGGRFVFPFEKD